MRRFPLFVTLITTAACGGSRDAVGRDSSNATPPLVVETGIAVPAPARTVSYADTLHGVAIPDPMRWLEDTTQAEVQRWVAEEMRYTDSVVARTVGRDSLKAVVERAYRDTPTLDKVFSTPRGLLLTRWLGDAPSLLAVDSGQSSERAVVSADTLKARVSGAELRAITPSWDGRMAALGTTRQGDDDARISVIDVATGKLLADQIPDLLTSTSGTRYEVTWLPDGSGFFYPRLWPGSATGPAADRLARGRQFLHRLGTPQSADRPVFGFDVTPSVVLDKVDLPTRVHTAPGSTWLVASVFRSKANGTDYFYAPLPNMAPNAPAAVPDWQPLSAISERISQPQLRGDTLYALSRNGADRGSIVRRLLAAGAASQWSVVLPEQRGVITAFTVQRDGVYATVRERGAVSLVRVPPSGTSQSAAPTTVALPSTGTVRLLRGAPSESGAVLSVESWATPPHWLRVSANGASATPLLVNDGSAAATSAGTIAARLEAPSKDGTLVPVSLVYGAAALRNGKLDGTAPLLIEAYGGFGQSTDPFYFPLVHTWVALGGVYAYAHVRGGGELGDAWHTAAMRENKQRSIDDMIGAIEQLIRERYTSAGRVTITGTSFGANIPGLVMVQRPELLGAVLYEVGQPDEIRGSELDPTAARNIAEIGDLETADGIRSLVKSSPYHQIPSRVKLPAIIVHSASEDYNFGTQMLPAKFVARLQQANSGTRPVLWMRTAGGHRSLFGLSPGHAATALSFALWQSGDGRYQPANGGAAK